MENARGNCIKYGDNVDTDVIIPARYLAIQDRSLLATHAMEDIDKDFHKKMKKGDILIAGKNFGCGSSREPAPPFFSFLPAFLQNASEEIPYRFFPVGRSLFSFVPLASFSGFECSSSGDFRLNTGRLRESERV